MKTETILNAMVRAYDMRGGIRWAHYGKRHNRATQYNTFRAALLRRDEQQRERVRRLVAELENAGFTLHLHGDTDAVMRINAALADVEVKDA